MFKFDNIIVGRFLKRYKRFMVDFERNGVVETAFNPNTGSMKGLLNEGCLIALSISDNTKRKYKYTVEGFQLDGNWVYTNTINVNRIVEYYIKDGAIKELYPYDYLKREYSIGDSRIDFYLEKDGRKILVEVKNVTLLNDNGIAAFPDAKTERGRKHLRLLTEMSKQGYDCYIFYVIAVDAKSFECAWYIDSLYCKEYKEALNYGVKPIFYRNHFNVDRKEVILKPMGN
ncbi:DNA/RNA nuclease SfsA [Deferribacter autotrophicus]|uniref:Sugar fermentation stimulation protein homolog n=1 Tax=Deferribacter autotrophicus TaxID=500465 RepID=A0A5A8F6W7_9BACT|nr:DNA/RNA nuclease SfsA [Deferribacter autotrophicus]KAA0259248.1 DNA/RNA nuclease SfsA [Deferribacter autotrophicus]